jgi:hypothetical protein
VTPLIVAIAALAVVVIGVGLMIITRSRKRDDEGDRFRRVADLTSKWSRQGSGAVQTTESVDSAGLPPGRSP